MQETSWTYVQKTKLSLVLPLLTAHQQWDRLLESVEGR